MITPFEALSKVLKQLEVVQSMTQSKLKVPKIRTSSTSLHLDIEQSIILDRTPAPYRGPSEGIRCVE